MRWVVLPALLAAAWLGASAAQEDGGFAERLEEREATLLGKLAEAERQVDLQARALRAAQARLRASSARLAAAEAKAAADAAEEAASAAAVGPRLVARYRLGREGYLRFLVGAQSIADLLRRRQQLDALLGSDLAALARLRSAARSTRTARDELAQVRDELARSAAAEAERRAELEAGAAQQRRLLASVQQDKALHEQAQRELGEAARDLGSELGKLEKPAGPLSGAVVQAPEGLTKKLRGKLLFPVEVGRVEAHFGRAVDPRFGTVTLQRGIDVRCEPGSPVRAVHAGKIVHAGWFHGYGNLIIIAHGANYFTLMAHLGTLSRATENEVKRGDVVGTVGDSGSLKGAYLYFELRHGQKPLDPERWLARPRKRALLAGKAAPP